MNLLPFVLLLVFIGLSIPIAASLGLLGIISAYLYSPLPLTGALGQVAWGTGTGFLLMAIPLFILLGEILLRSGFADRMYGAMSLWLSWLPGGLMHANIGACALFAATSGSSVATAATVGTVAIPQLYRHSYNKSLFFGSITAGGTLGILIPPSINLILYGVLTNTSVPKLYLAGFIPGILLSVLFMLVILIACLVEPIWGGHVTRATWKARFRSLVDLIPPLGLFLLVVGSIYAGFATATEAASLGVLGALILAAMSRTLTLRMLRESVENTMRSTVMVLLIVIASAFLSFILSGTGITSTITTAVAALHLDPYWLLLLVIALYLILGCLMESLSMMITTVPIIAPIMITAGFDPIWFGIVVVILVEAALITPPVGINLFVVHSLVKNESLNTIIVGSLPFVIAMLALIGIITVFPSVALWLPTVIQY
jgi:tripartite ATP-independent transporter DctM subunit